MIHWLYPGNMVTNCRLVTSLFVDAETGSKDKGGYGMEFTIWIVYMIIMNVVHTLTVVIPVSDPMWQVGLSLYSQVGANILCIYIFRKYLYHKNEMRLISKKGLKCCVWATVIGIGVCFGHRIFFLLFIGFAEQSLRDVGEVVLTNGAMFSATVPGILYVALLAPVTEELILRGIIFPVARQKRGNLYAIIISSIFFGLIHMNGIQFISAMFAGVIIGYAIILTDNVYIGIIIHAVNNSFSLFNDNVLNDKVWGMYSGGGFIQIAIGIIILIVGILMLRWETGRGKRYS